ncbi:YtcA family lipoprotein [Paraburkholderia sp. C35]|uniref:YtcA family lipoprotein n=1 Tax=Paraburkholderia sp. C35 TaxID=2126993 RepID=UPI000D69B99E|nr:YtcA family lipoprotein [Paraburkholderia sp. C35]
MPVIRPILLIVFSLTASGCTMPQSISVLGSFFPDWLFCSVAGLVLALLVRAVLIKLGQARALGPPVIVQPTLMLLFALLVWLIFF